MKKADFIFSPDLKVFLKPPSRSISFEYQFNGPQSVKHLFEAAGVPHTEVSEVRVNGNPVSFDYLVEDTDQVEVSSFSDRSLPASALSERSNFNSSDPSLPASVLRERSNLSPSDPSLPASVLSERSNLDSSDLSLRASVLSERSNLNDLTTQPTNQSTTLPPDPRFILDNHLGKLASYLRMLGFDCLYQNDFQDDELALRAQQEARILLTRDHRLLMRKSIEHGYWLRSQNPRQQLKEILIRYALFDRIKPFQRCMRCNQLLESVPKASILHLLQPLTKQYFDEFRQCPDCGQIYWQGSHYKKMLAFIQDLARDHPGQ